MAPYKMSPGQKKAVEKLILNYYEKDKQTLLGITGSGKTFVMANVINRLQKPTLILAHNKTLAAQLYAELRELFPNNRVEYFISFYSYYQPESYLPTTDMYIEKDSDINEQIEKMRMHAVSSILSREDTIIVASISCIFGLGNPDYFEGLALDLNIEKKMRRRELLQKLVSIQYERNDKVLETGRFRVRGNVIDVIPSYEEEILRIELENDKIKNLKEVDPITGDIKSIIDRKDPAVEIVLTGRGATGELIEMADLVTEMKKIKHPFDKGLPARRGIEF